MGWVWKDDDDDDDDDRNSGEINKFEDINPRSDGQCSTRKIIASQCRTEEVEPGKFIRKCEKTEKLLKDCVGRPSEEVQSNKEYTEEDVTEEMTKGSFRMPSSELQPFDFPGLRSDIEAIERNLFGNINRLFEAAEDMKNGFFSIFESPPQLYKPEPEPEPRPRHSVPIEPSSPSKAVKDDTRDGRVDLSGLARDV